MHSPKHRVRLDRSDEPTALNVDQSTLDRKQPMKSRTWIATALASLAATTSYAQSSVTLFGIVDVGARSVRNGGVTVRQIAPDGMLNSPLDSGPRRTWAVVTRRGRGWRPRSTPTPERSTLRGSSGIDALPSASSVPLVRSELGVTLTHRLESFGLRSVRNRRRRLQLQPAEQPRQRRRDADSCRQRDQLLPAAEPPATSTGSLRSQLARVCPATSTRRRALATSRGR